MVNKWTRSDDVVWEELDGEVLLVSPRNGARWLLNTAASAIWKLCDGQWAAAEAATFCASLESLGLMKPAGKAQAQLVGATMHFGALPKLTELSAGGGGRRRPRPGGVSGPV